MWMDRPSLFRRGDVHEAARKACMGLHGRRGSGLLERAAEVLGSECGCRGRERGVSQG